MEHTVISYRNLRDCGVQERGHVALQRRDKGTLRKAEEKRFRRGPFGARAKPGDRTRSPRRRCWATRTPRLHSWNLSFGHNSRRYGRSNNGHVCCSGVTFFQILIEAVKSRITIDVQKRQPSHRAMAGNEKIFNLLQCFWSYSKMFSFPAILLCEKAEKRVFFLALCFEPTLFNCQFRVAFTRWSQVVSFSHECLSLSLWFWEVAEKPPKWRANIKPVRKHGYSP